LQAAARVKYYAMDSAIQAQQAAAEAARKQADQVHGETLSRCWSVDVAAIHHMRRCVLGAVSSSCVSSSVKQGLQFQLAQWLS
jgi:hypothetical protein